MAVLRNNDSRIPYLSDNKNLSLGLNPLGMRNAGEVIYQTLLMGLNNVTQHIRYYSFYCWLLDKFYSSRQHASVEEFRKFLRRSEYLLALIEAVGENAGGVPGISRQLSIRCSFQLYGAGQSQKLTCSLTLPSNASAVQ